MRPMEMDPEAEARAGGGERRLSGANPPPYARRRRPLRRSTVTTLVSWRRRRLMLTQDKRQPFGEHVAGLRRYARALTAVPAQADALVEACLTRALESVLSRKDVRDVRLFLFTIMHEIYADFAAGKESQGSGPAARPQAMSAIEAALQMLPWEQRETLLLLSMGGMTYDEVSKITSVSVDTVMLRLSRGREWLRCHMDASIADP